MKYILFILLFASQETFARYSNIAIEKVLNNYELIAKIKIIDSIPHYWQSPRGKRICGYTITAEVLDNIKGDSVGEIKFGSQNIGISRQTQLAFMKQFEGDFPSDVIINYDSNFQSFKGSCLAQLPSLKISSLVGFKYSTSEEIIYPSFLLTFPKEIAINTIETQKVLLNDKEVSVKDIPFDISKDLATGERKSVRYINAKSLEEWFKKKLNNMN